jgi:hypothetical protein
MGIVCQDKELKVRSGKRIVKSANNRRPGEATCKRKIAAPQTLTATGGCCNLDLHALPLQYQAGWDSTTRDSAKADG